MTLQSAEAYEVKRQAHVAYLSKLMPGLMARLAWPPQRIAAEQLRALKETLAHAREHCPWHRARLPKVDIDAFRLDAIERLPTMSKIDLMANWDGIVTRPGLSLDAAEDHLEEVARLGSGRYFDGDCYVYTSAGSSGRRGVFIGDWHGWATFFASAMRQQALALAKVEKRLGRSPRIAVIGGGERGIHATSAIAQTFAAGNRSSYRHILASSPPRHVLAALQEHRPDVLFTYPTVLAGLAEEARMARLDIPLRAVFSSGEVLTGEVKQLAQRTWPLLMPVLNTWMTAESGASFACLAGEGMHLCDDLNVIEPLDRAGCTTQAGETSDFVRLTVLYNRILPLIRYDIEDRLRLADEPCGCGSRFRRCAGIEGRAHEIFYYGPAAVQPAVFFRLLERDRRITRYQVRQTVRGARIIVVAPSGMPSQDLSRLEADVVAALVAQGLPQAAITAERVDDIPLLPSGKQPRFVPLQRAAS